MVGRLLVVVWILCLTAGLIWHFSDALFALLQKAWILSKDDLERLNTLLEIASKALAVLAVVISFAWAFVAGKKKLDETTGKSGNTAIFHGKVKIGRDFVQGNKITLNNGSKDA